MQIGELSKRVGMSIRALRHYEDIGLLPVAERSAAGYRLYNQQSIKRLLHIQLLKQLGFALSDIRQLIHGQHNDFALQLEQHLHLLAEKAKQLQDLHERLSLLQTQLQLGHEPSTEDWLNSLESLTMYEKHFSTEELKQLPLYTAFGEKLNTWQERVTQAQTFMQKQTPCSDLALQDFARAWMLALEQDTNGNADFFQRLNQAHLSDLGMMALTGIDQNMVDYIAAAFQAAQLNLMRPFFTETEFNLIAPRYGQNGHRWPELIGRLHRLIIDEEPTDGVNALQFAEDWLALHDAITGGDKILLDKMRQAFTEDTRLSQGTWFNPARRDYLQKTIQNYLRNKS